MYFLLYIFMVLIRYNGTMLTTKRKTVVKKVRKGRDNVEYYDRAVVKPAERILSALSRSQKSKSNPR
jgi:hypothetical protein